MSVTYIARLPLSERRRSTDERFDAIDARLDAMSAELRDMLVIVKRIATTLGGGAR